MGALTEPARHDGQSLINRLLTTEMLTALMRSTWTWDDRALRRDLSSLLVQLTTADYVADELGSESAVARSMRSAARAQATIFSTEVLGTALVADNGNKLRPWFSDFSCATAVYGHEAHVARRESEAEFPEYARARVGGVEYAPEARWGTLVRDNGIAGLGEAMRAFGYRFGDSPFFATSALAWQAVQAVPNCESAAAYSEHLLSGRIIGTLAAAEQSGSWDPALVRTRAEKRDGRWRISGTKSFVSAADVADVILVIARTTAGPSLFAVDAGSPGLNIEAQSTIDDTRPLYTTQFSSASASLMGAEGSGGSLMSVLLDCATTALAAEQVGLIEAAIGIAVHASLRDTRVTELMYHHAAAHALWQRAVVDPTPVTAAAAHIGCTAAARQSATTIAELCGPNGGTGALLRRVLSGGLLFGGPALSHERLLGRLGI